MHKEDSIRSGVSSLTGTLKSYGHPIIKYYSNPPIPFTRRAGFRGAEEDRVQLSSQK